ncbi:unnamed protein product [Chrysoparadoxa australica]
MVVPAQLLSQSITYSTSIDITNPNKVTFDGSPFSLSSYETAPIGFAFSSDGMKLFVVGGGAVSVIQFSLSSAFDTSSGITHDGSFDLSNEDDFPFDIFFDHTGTKMFILGNTDQEINQYTLTTPFSITSGVTYDGSPLDLSTEDTNSQAFTFNFDGDKLYVIGAGAGEINQYSLSTPFDITSGVSHDGTPLDISSYDTSPISIVFNTNGSKLFVLGGGKDSVNQYVLSTPYDITTGVSFQGSFDVTNQESFPTALKFHDNYMFVMGSWDIEINRYMLSTSIFVETLGNAGSLNGGMILRISDETFTNQGSTLTHEVDYTVDNLPTGLIPQLNISTDGLTASLTISGSASSHEALDGVNDLQFTFENTAFTGGDASAVANSSAFSSGLGIEFTDAPTLSYFPSPDNSRA